MKTLSRTITANLLRATIAATLCGASAAHGTVLTFDQTRVDVAPRVVATYDGAMVQDDYGDRVDATTQTVNDGTYTYGVGNEGFTPNVSVSYFVLGGLKGTGASLWTSGYGDLDNVLFGDQTAGILNILLRADAGYHAVLEGFSIAGWFQSDVIVDSVSMYADGGLRYFGDVMHIAGGEDNHTSFETFNIAGSEVLLSIDYSNLSRDVGTPKSVGLDNIRFGQLFVGEIPTTVPEPASAGLLGLGLMLLGSRFRRPRAAAQ